MNQPYTANRWKTIARRTRHLVLLVLLGTLALAIPMSVLAGATVPDLGTAGSFGVLAGSAVTNTGATQVLGDVGVSPGSAITGFPPGVLSGTIHAGDTVALQAHNDATAAYNTAAAQACGTDLTGQNLGGMTLVPGVYCFTTSAQLSGQLTLDGKGNPNSVFIFQLGSTLTTASSAHVLLINGAEPCNVFWQVGSSATLGTNTHFEGNLLALTSITLNTGVQTTAGLYALDGAATLDTNTVQACGFVQGSTSTPTSVSTGTATATSTVTATVTVLSPTNTVTQVATGTPPRTSTAIITATATATATTTAILPTATATFTTTATNTRIAGVTNTPRPIDTNTSIPVATNTPDNTSTTTPANTATASAVATSSVPSQTAIATETEISTPSVTGTVTDTAITTATPTPIIATPTVAVTLNTATSIPTVAATIANTYTPVPPVIAPKDVSVTTQTAPPVAPPFLPRTGVAYPWAGILLLLGLLLLMAGLNIRMRFRKAGIDKVR